MPPLSHVPGLWDAMDVAAFVATRSVEHSVTHLNDIFGGSTHLRSRFELHHSADLVHVDGVHVAVDAECRELRALTDAHPLRHGVGATLIGEGTAFSHCCADSHAFAEQPHMAAASGVRAALRVCLRQIATAEWVGEPGRVLRVALVPVDPWSIVGSLDVDFKHAPGNRSVAEAVAEARKRQYDWINYEKVERMEAFNWNYDAAGRKSRGALNLLTQRSSFARAFSRLASCVDCHAYWGVGVEFQIKVTRSWWGFPHLEALRVLVFGELSAAAVVRVALPHSPTLECEHQLLERALTLRGVVIPAGPLAFLLTPSLKPQLVGGLASNMDNQIDIGAKGSLTVRVGMQWNDDERGAQLINDVVSDVALINDWNNVVSTAGSTNVGLRVGLRLSLNVGLALGLTAASLATGAGVKFTAVTFNLLPAAVFSVAPSSRCTTGTRHEMKLERGVTVDAALDVITISFNAFGKMWSQTIGMGGSLPWQSRALAVVNSGVPPGCAVCQVCLTPALPRARVAVAPRVQSQRVDVPRSVFTVRTPAIVVSLTVDGRPATSVSFGQSSIAINWRMEQGTAPRTVKVAGEVRRSMTDAGSVVADVVGAAPFSWTANRATLDTSRSGSPLRVVSGNQVRFAVISATDERVFGHSPWVSVTVAATSTALTSSALRWTYDQWSFCSVTCGPNAWRTRTATCTLSSGRPVAQTQCFSLAAPLTRERCPNAPTVCPVRPIVQPVPQYGARSTAPVRFGTKRAVSMPSAVPVQLAGGQLTSTIDVFVCPMTVVLECESDLKLVDTKCRKASNLVPSPDGFIDSTVMVDAALYGTIPDFMNARLFDNYATLSTVVRLVSRVVNDSSAAGAFVGDQVFVGPAGQFSYTLDGKLPSGVTNIIVRGTLASLTIDAPVLGRRYDAEDLGDVLSIFLSPTPTGSDARSGNVNVTRFYDNARVDSCPFQTLSASIGLMVPARMAGDPDAPKYFSQLTVKPDALLTDGVRRRCALLKSPPLERQAPLNDENAEIPLEVDASGNPVLPTGAPNGDNLELLNDDEWVPEETQVAAAHVAQLGVVLATFLTVTAQL